MSRQKIALVLLVVTAVATVGVATAAGNGRSSGLSERQIKRIALKAARQAGDSHPILIQHADGRRDEANGIAFGEVVPGYTWCDLIAIRGRFGLNDVSSPPGAKAPAGTVMTLLVDAKTGERLDFGVSDHYPELKNSGR